MAVKDGSLDLLVAVVDHFCSFFEIFLNLGGFHEVCTLTRPCLYLYGKVLYLTSFPSTSVKSTNGLSSANCLVVARAILVCRFKCNKVFNPPVGNRASDRSGLWGRKEEGAML